MHRIKSFFGMKQNVGPETSGTSVDESVNTLATESVNQNETENPQSVNSKNPESANPKQDRLNEVTTESTSLQRSQNNQTDQSLSSYVDRARAKMHRQIHSDIQRSTEPRPDIVDLFKGNSKEFTGVLETRVGIDIPESEYVEPKPPPCFSCKVVTVGCCYGMAGYVLYIVKRDYHKVSSLGDKSRYIRTGILSTILFGLGTCLIFDINPMGQTGKQFDRWWEKMIRDRQKQQEDAANQRQSNNVTANQRQSNNITRTKS